jgi:hypothetical protein
MYIRGFNSLAAIFLFFLLHAISCIFYNTISFSLSSLVPGLPILILILPSLHVHVIIMPSPCPSHIPTQIVKSHISYHTLPLYHVTVLSQSAPTPESPLAPYHKFPRFCLHSLPAPYTMLHRTYHSPLNSPPCLNPHLQPPNYPLYPSSS